jgi:S1-C subfamily serine protease
MTDDFEGGPGLTARPPLFPDPAVLVVRETHGDRTYCERSLCPLHEGRKSGPLSGSHRAMRSWKYLVLALAFAMAPSVSVTAQTPAQQPASAQPAPSKAYRSIPDDNLAYPVLITVKTASAASSGSGFFLNTGKALYLVTAKHVLYNQRPTKDDQLWEAHILAYSKDIATNDATNKADLDLFSLEKSGNLKPHPQQDVAVIKIASVEASQETSQQVRFKSTPVAGVRFTEMAPSGVLGVDLKDVLKLSNVLIGNEVILFGYPTSLGLAERPQLDPYRPLLRRGMVAGINPSLKSIILDCPVYYGNSGGPVIEVDRYNVFQEHFSLLGVIVEFVPFVDQGKNFLSLSNSGYSVVVPMDFVLELVNTGS